MLIIVETFVLILQTLLLCAKILYQLQLELSTTKSGGTKMTNQDIRRTAAGAGVKLWQIAEALGIADCSLSRKLRKELPAEEKEKIFGIIRELSQEVS